MAITLRQALITAEHAFGATGRRTVELWQQYNQAYFDGKLRPTPIIYVPTSTYGHWVGCTHYRHDQERASLIYLMRKDWQMVRGILLHEMVHQCLVEAGQDASHAGQPWRDQIMRISGEHFGVNFHAGRIKVIKEKKTRKSIKLNEGDLTQGEIARWPQSVHIIPPDLIHSGDYLSCR
jgi:predicted SprT family Zn-dependent metalloprotease